MDHWTVLEQMQAYRSSGKLLKVRLSETPPTPLPLSAKDRLYHLPTPGGQRGQEGIGKAMGAFVAALQPDACICTDLLLIHFHLVIPPDAPILMSMRS